MFKRARIPEKQILQQLLDELHVAESRQDAFQVFCAAVGQIGFNGAMFVSRASGPKWQEEISETTYPEDWIRHYVASGYTRTDPCRRFGFRQAKPFFWSELTPLLRKKDMRPFEEAREHGLVAGLSMPIFDSGALIGGVGMVSEVEITDPRLKTTLGIAAQMFCTVYNQIVSESRETRLSADDFRSDLTKREMEVLTILASGMGNAQIADALHISQSAVEYHIKNIFEKLGVENRVSAAVMGIRLGLISPE